MHLALTTLQLPTPSMITLSLSAPSMHAFLLPLVLTPPPHLCPCHALLQNETETLAFLKSSSAYGLDSIPSLPLKTSKSIISRPLSNILNSSISSSTFPSSWKCSSIRPLHKGGSQACLSNYWPISTLPSCSKLLGRHVKEQVTEHLDSNNLLYSYQSGFHSTHSTQSLLLHCTNKWYQALDQKQFVAVLFLDVSKALQRQPSS